MIKFSLLSRNVLKCRASILDPIRMAPSRSCSTVEEQQEPVADSFYGSSQGAVYGRLTGFGRNTLKTDIIHFYEGCNLSTSDVKFEYNNSFNPISMLLQFPSQSSYDAALRQTMRKGRLYKLDKINSGQWDITESHDGKTVLIQGIPSNAVREDIERFLSGCNFDPKSFRFISRNALQNTVKAVAVRVASGLEAVNFKIRKNRNIIFNAPVTVRVLQ